MVKKIFIILSIFFIVLIVVYTISKKNIYTEIVINASIERVYKTLVDFEQYPKWNPYHKTVKGKAVAGGNMEVLIHKFFE